ncbi:unnamed protein product [Prorocentrum cordatum]|uniref:Uncharacterized protein n=1 Tax=Prorocentrum cordatum TaxID=2364126 RepID=A0ABN9SWZ6_9DINO|nr:unnamed protein product [Polarella glacialis]
MKGWSAGDGWAAAPTQWGSAAAAAAIALEPRNASHILKSLKLHSDYDVRSSTQISWIVAGLQSLAPGARKGPEATPDGSSAYPRDPCGPFCSVFTSPVLFFFCC